MKKDKTAGMAERIGRAGGEGAVEGIRSRIKPLLEQEIGPFWRKLHRGVPRTAQKTVRRAANEAKDIGSQAIRSISLPVGLGAATGAATAPSGERGEGAVRGAVGGLAGGLVGSAWGRPLPETAVAAKRVLTLGSGALLGAGAGASLRHGNVKKAQTREKSMKNKYAGVTLDWYDDKGATLKTKFPTLESLPSVIKTAAVQPMENLDNEDFALVALDEGNVMRKYACHDAGTTAMSVVYFMEHGDKLPEGAQKTAAANLVMACKQFNLQPPSALVKMAALSRLGQVIERRRAGKKEPEKTATGFGGGEVGFGESESQKQAEDTLAGGKADGKSSSNFSRSQMGMGKKVEMEHTNNKDLAAEIARDHLEEIPDYYTRLDKMEAQAKQANVVDITGKHPAPKMKTAAPNGPEDYAVILNGKGYYPINTWDLVKKAEVYFQEEKGRMQPEVRRQYATKLASRASSMGYPLDPDILEAGSSSWAPKGHLKAAVEMRKIACQPGSENRKFLDELFEKRASIEPNTYAEVLRRFDVQNGLDKGWDHVILDPWSSTFGLDKTAEVVWEDGADRVTSEDLLRLAQNHVALDNSFTDEMRKEFIKDPTGIFESMPLPQKRVIARLAADLPYQSEALAL